MEAREEMVKELELLICSTLIFRAVSLPTLQGKPSVRTQESGATVAVLSPKTSQYLAI
jgi:hypothetical protein